MLPAEDQVKLNKQGQPSSLLELNECHTEPVTKQLLHRRRRETIAALQQVIRQLRIDELQDVHSQSTTVKLHEWEAGQEDIPDYSDIRMPDVEAVRDMLGINDENQQQSSPSGLMTLRTKRPHPPSNAGSVQKKHRREMIVALQAIKHVLEDAANSDDETVNALDDYGPVVVQAIRVPSLDEVRSIARTHDESDDDDGEEEESEAALASRFSFMEMKSAPASCNMPVRTR